MNAREVGQLLAEISGIDHRPVDEGTVLLWLPLVSDLDYRTATEALRLHRRESTAWLVPAHIRQNVTRIVNAQAHPEDEWGNELEPDVGALTARARLGAQRAVTS